MLLLSHKTVLPDGKLLNVTKSVTHPDCPERTDGVIRMEVGIAGMLCYASTVRPGACEILQIGGGDPKGSIPKAIINFGPCVVVGASARATPWRRGLTACARPGWARTHMHAVTTKAVPIATEKLNGVLRKLTPLDPPGSAPAPRPRRRRAGAGGAVATVDLTDAIARVRVPYRPPLCAHRPWTAQTLTPLCRSVPSHSRQLTAKLDVIERSVKEQQAAAAAAQTGSTLEQVRDVLDWATPFMLATIYAVGLYMVVRARASPR